MRREEEEGEEEREDTGGRLGRFFFLGGGEFVAEGHESDCSCFGCGERGEGKKERKEGRNEEKGKKANIQRPHQQGFSFLLRQEVHPEKP